MNMSEYITTVEYPGTNFECPAMEELSCLECRKKYWFAEVHE